MARPNHRRKIIERNGAKLGVSYARYSTTLQASVEQQHRTNGGVAEEEGVTIVEWFQDRAVSRTVDDRDGLQELFAYLEAHPEVEYIVINELERLTSGIAQRAKVIEICRALQVALLTEDIGVIRPDDDDKMQEADVRAVAAQGEVLKGRRRVKRSMKDLAHTEGRFIMRPCFGMRNREVDNGAPVLPDEITPEGLIVRAGPWELHDGEYPWLVKIFEWADQDLTLHEIARNLVENNVRTKTGKPNWRPATIKQILANDFYIGIYEYGKHEVKRDGPYKYTELRPDTHANRVTRRSPLGEMVERDLWERVQAKRLERVESGDARFTNPGRRTVPAQVFDDRIFCGRCGYKMYGAPDMPRRSHDGGVPPFRYTCKKGDAVSRVPMGGDFAPPCTESHSITDRQLLAELAGFCEATEFIALDPFRNDFDRAEKRRDAKEEAARAKRRFERTKALHLEGLEAIEEVRAAKATWDAAAGRANTASSTDKFPTVVPGYLKETNWAEVAEVLASEALAVTNRQALLTLGGLTRIYVLNGTPVIKPQFRPR